MKTIYSSVLALLTLALASLVPLAPAKADVIMASAKSTLCLDVNGNTQYVALWGCHGGANQNFFTSAYGPQKYNGRCLDHGPLRDKYNGNGELMMLPCVNGKVSQIWSLVGNPRDVNNGRLRNQEGWCVNIPGGMRAANQGQGLIVWTCQKGASNPNDMWVQGRYTPMSTIRWPLGVTNNLQTPGTLYVPPTPLLSTNGGNVIAAGGGNVIAAGGGNVIAAGGGNVIAAGGGNVIAAGGGNVIITDGGAVIAAGGGNVIAAGGGNIIGSNSAEVVGPAAGSLVGTSGALFHQ